MASKTKKLRFRFDVSTFKLLGRELITDRITALFELVKNAYDANAERVDISFHNVGAITKDSKITIADDGIGMTIDDIQNRWMVIGTNSKRGTNKFSPPPFKRRLVGEKGVGRFAVEKLGSRLILKTKTTGSKEVVVLEIDWRKYEKLSKQLDLFPMNSDKTYFTDIDNELRLETPGGNYRGTSLEISLFEREQIWTKSDIERASKELAKIVSPLKKFSYPFSIQIQSNEHKEFQNYTVENNAIRYATKEISLNYNDATQETLKFEGSHLTTTKVPFRAMGPVKMTLYYFDQAAKRKFKDKYKGEVIDGIKIYRDDVIATPFAEYAAKDTKKRDILGIDKRRYSGFFDKVSSRDLIGYVDITRDNNPRIIEATNRQDFVDNEEYRDLKDFIIEQLEELEKWLTYEKNKDKQKTKSNLADSRTDLSDFVKEIKQLKENAPSNLQQPLDRIEKQAKKVQKDVNRGLKAFQDLEKEKDRQENLFLSLMSLQDYALELSHVVRISLAKILHLAEFFKTDFPNPEYDNLFLVYADSILNEMLSLDKAIDFMLSYARSDIGFEEIDVKETIENLFLSYTRAFKAENISTIVEIDNPLIITHNRKFIEDIFENLISNSIKALEGTEEKIIKCTGLVEEENFVIYFSDNGYGIAKENQHKIFDIYFTTTAEQGGAGIGLFTVAKRIEALQGSIEVVESEFTPLGATFKIVLPFKRL